MLKISGSTARSREALSEIIRSELKDPRIHPMTSVVPGREVTPDLKICKAYISVLGGRGAGKRYDPRLKERGGLYQDPAREEDQPPEYSGDLLRAGSVHRVRRPHVKAHR